MPTRDSAKAGSIACKVFLIYFLVFPWRLPILLRADLNSKKGYNNNFSRTFFLVERTDTVYKFQRHNYTVDSFEKDPIQIQPKSLMITIRKVKTI